MPHRALRASLGFLSHRIVQQNPVQAHACKTDLNAEVIPMDHSLLYGWDDGKIYFNESGKAERCVNDEPELLQILLFQCKEYYAEKAQSVSKQG
jgi:hypothetical protein